MNYKLLVVNVITTGLNSNLDPKFQEPAFGVYTECESHWKKTKQNFKNTHILFMYQAVKCLGCPLNSVLC
jgi:hypothetical protein